MCMSIVFPSFLLTFFPSFIQQTFIYLSRTGYGLSTELGAEALFVDGHVLPRSLVVKNRVATLITMQFGGEFRDEEALGGCVGA